MSKSSLAYIDIRAFVHATEDLDKVMTAIQNVVPAELLEDIAVKKKTLKGHYGNPIILLEARIKGAGNVTAVSQRLASGLSTLDKEFLSSTLTQHLERGNLFLRMDKQSAYFNELRLRSDDPIRLRIHFKKSNPEEITEICRRLGMLI